MRKLAIVVAIVALMANVGIIVGIILDGGEGPSGSNAGPEEGIERIEGPDSLTVPLIMIDDQAKYDYSFFAQMFYENRSSGEWERYTFSGEGQFLQYVGDPVDKDDGFGRSHRSVLLSYNTRASFQVKIEGSDKDTVTIPGEIEVDRSDFRNVFDGHQILALNQGSLSISGLGSGFGSLPADVSYMANLRTYPDPNEEAAVSMEDAIYGNGQVLNQYSKGQFVPPSSAEDPMIYDWRIDGAYSVHGHDTYLVNVTTKFWEFLNFKRQIYISEDSPFYIKGSTVTNTSFEDEDEEFYIIIRFEMDLDQDPGSLIRGTTEVPWGDTQGHEEYVLDHPSGEFKTWDMTPQDGEGEDLSSFDDFTLNDAVDYAKANSKELQGFLAEMEAKGAVLVSDAVFNVSKEDRLGRNNTKWWNLTFAYVTEQQDVWDYYEENGEWPEWAYRILVARSVEDRVSGTKVSTFISKDEGDDYHGRRRGALDISDLNLDREILTLTAAERLLKSDPEIKGATYTDSKLSEGVAFYYGIVGISSNTLPSLTLIEQLLGFKTPSADNAYGVQNGQVWDSGSTFSAAVDANSGQLLYVTNVEGSQLSSIFG